MVSFTSKKRFYEKYIFKNLISDNACNGLFNPDNRNQFLGCPTVPNQRKLWEIELSVPTIIPALNNVRVRCKKDIKILFCLIF